MSRPWVGRTLLAAAGGTIVAALACSRRPAEEPVVFRPPPVPVVLETDASGIPAFPPPLYAAGVQRAVVVVDLAVGADGRVDSSATRVLETSHALFTDAVRAVLPRWRVASPGALDTARGPRRVRVEFVIGDSVGIPTFTRAGGAPGTPTRYVVGERPLRGAGRALAPGAVADSIVAAVRAATHDAIVRSVLYFPRDEAATARWVGEKRMNKGGYSRSTGRCIVRRTGAARVWTARCGSGGTIEAVGSSSGTPAIPPAGTRP